MNIKLEDFVRLSADIYFPKVEFFYPEIKINNSENQANNKGFYKDSFLQEKHGWYREYESDFLRNGFSAAYYTRKGNNQKGVIAFRGSDDLYDFLYHDFKLSLGEWPKAYIDALYFYHTIIDRYSPSFISFTGHSLGGALAQLVGITVNEKRHNLFKFPVVCFNAPQMGYLVEYNKSRKESSSINRIVENISKVLEVHKRNRGGLVANSNLTSKVISSLPDIFSNAKSLYGHIISYKDLKVSFDNNQLAFNAVYDLLTSDMQVNIKNKSLFNRIDYKQNILRFEQKYNYIFNFNSLFDLVNTLGIPLGTNLAIDIDLKKNSAYSQSRLRCELRAILTQFDDYFSSNDLNYNFIKNNERVYKYSYTKVSEKLNCKVNLKNYMGHTPIDALDIFKLLPGILLPKENSKAKSYIDELEYMAGFQHSIINLGNKILENKELSSINIGKNFLSVSSLLKKYQKNSFNIKSEEDIKARIDYILGNLNISDTTKLTSCSSINYDSSSIIL